MEWSYIRGILVGVLFGIATLHTRHLNAADQAELAVLIDNIGGVSAFTLVGAQDHTTNVLRQAGVKIRWLECSFAEAEYRDPPGCQVPLDVPTVIVKILPKAQAERWITPPKALGFSRDTDIFVLLHRVELLAAQKNMAKSVILGHVMAHEIGHALLGPGHSAGGLMRNWLRITELRLAEKGQLQFSPKEAAQIRQRTRILRGGPLKPPDQTSTRSRAAASVSSNSR